MPLPSPVVGQHVRVRAEGFDRIGTVATVDGDDRLRLDIVLDEDLNDAEVSFHCPRGLVCMNGSLRVAGAFARFQCTTDRRVEQRRAAYRVSVGCRATVIDDTGLKLACTVTDLSLLGVLLGTDSEPLTVGQSVEVSLDINGSSVEIRGTVIRADGARRAVKFDELTDWQDKILGRYLADEQRRRL